MLRPPPQSTRPDTLCPSPTLFRSRARAQPAADDGLGLAAAVARHPGGVRIGGIDGIEAVFDEGVEDVEAGGLVQGPAEDVAAQDQRGDLKAGAAKRTG